MDKKEEIIINLIVYSGNARSLAMKALRSAKEGKKEEATEFIKEAKDSISIAHESQTTMIQKEAGGEKQEVSLLMVHAQDHLMNALTVIDLVSELIDTF